MAVGATGSAKTWPQSPKPALGGPGRWCPSRKRRLTTWKSQIGRRLVGRQVAELVNHKNGGAGVGPKLVVAGAFKVGRLKCGDHVVRVDGLHRA